ncbi:hypothetical protein [Streptomyces sp. NPDC056387]
MTRSSSRTTTTTTPGLRAVAQLPDGVDDRRIGASARVGLYGTR